MYPYLYLESLTYDGIGDFIASAVEKSEDSPLYLLGRAAVYIDVAAALGRISPLEALELRTVVAIHAGMIDAGSLEFQKAPDNDPTGSPIKPL